MRSVAIRYSRKNASSSDHGPTLPLPRWRNVRRDDDGTVAPLRARGLVVDTPTAAQRAQWQSAFTRTRARLVGTLADAAFFARVERAR